MKRSWILTIFVLFFVLLLAACAPAAEEPASEAAPVEESAPAEEAVEEPEAPTEAQEFVSWYQYDQNNEDPASDERVGNEYLRNTIPQFNEQFEGEWVWVNQPKAFDKMTTELVAAVQAGGDVPDLFELSNSQDIIPFYQNGTVQDLTEWAEAQSWWSDLDPNGIEGCKGPDGKLYCIPISQRPQLVYVWADRFPDGYPTTVDEFMTQAEALKEEGYKNITPVSPGDKVTIAGTEIEAVPMYNVEKTQYHPMENAWTGFIINIGGTRVYHAGDTERIPEMKELNCDIAMVPLGQVYTMNSVEEAAEAVLDTGAEIAIPIHYGMYEGSADDAKKFKELLEGKVKVVILD